MLLNRDSSFMSGQFLIAHGKQCELKLKKVRREIYLLKFFAESKVMFVISGANNLERFDQESSIGIVSGLKTQ
jgi:hypothetical protein